MVQKNNMNNEKKNVGVKKEESEKNVVHPQNKTKTGKSVIRRDDPSGLPKYR